MDWKETDKRLIRRESAPLGPPEEVLEVEAICGLSFELHIA